MAAPFLSICIPARNRSSIMRRLLDSIAVQTYTDFEVVVTDNSDDSQIADLVADYPSLNIRYSLNEPRTEMGENWNRCMEQATGRWIKLIHDDDWFTTPESLGAFARTAAHTRSGFIFSTYYNVDEQTHARTPVVISGFRKWLLKRSPFSLLAGNVIGPPSVTMIRKELLFPFRNHMKWIVDIDWYLKLLARGASFEVIQEPLICIGIHPEQATKSYFRNPVVEIPECLDLLSAWPRFYRNLFAYDYCWRLLRNLNIRSETTFESYAAGKPVPDVIRAMIRVRSACAPAVLQNKITSKGLMFFHWLHVNVRH
jgi:glycosyltransferase involved in cell wall biosynthesis